MSTASPSDDRFRGYVHKIEQLLEQRAPDKVIIRKLSRATKELCADGSWLQDDHRVGDPDRYTRHMLHRDPLGRFLVLALVWHQTRTRKGNRSSFAVQHRTQQGWETAAPPARSRTRRFSS